MRHALVLYLFAFGCANSDSDPTVDPSATAGKADGAAADEVWAKWGGRIAVGIHRCERIFGFYGQQDVGQEVDCVRQVVDAELATVDAATRQPSGTTQKFVQTFRTAGAAMTLVQREAEEYGLHNGERAILTLFREQSLARLIAAWIDVGGQSGWRAEPHSSDVSSVLKSCNSLASCEAQLEDLYGATLIEGIRYNSNADASARVATAFDDAFASFRGLCGLIAGKTAAPGAATTDAERCARSAVGQLDVELALSEYAPGY